MLQYLYPKQKIDQVVPPNSREHKQQLHDCVVASRETKSIKEKPKLCTVVKHGSFGENLIYCAERYAEVKVEGEEYGFFNKDKTDLPILANVPTFPAVDVCKPIDTSLLDMGGSGSTRSEDIALAQSQGLDVDDDNNEPAPENIPAVGTAIDSATNVHGQEWGWGGTCHRKSAYHVDVSPQIKDYTKIDLGVISKLDMFFLFLPINYLEEVIVIETSHTLVAQAYTSLTAGEFVRFLGCIFFMSCFSGVDQT
jgi:hypothetical protein